MSADELAGVNVALELATEIAASFLFGLAAAVCKEDIGSVEELERCT